MLSFDGIIRKGIILILVFSAFAFGGVEAWSLAISEISVLFLIAVYAIKIIRYRTSENMEDFKNEYFNGKNKYLLLFPSLFILFVIIQMIPFPADTIKLISPRTYDIFTDFSLAKRDFMTISLYSYATRIELIKIISYAGIIFLTISTVDTYENLRKAIKILIVIGFIVSLFGIVQKASWNGRIYWIRELTQGGEPFGPFVNRNHFAGFIEMIIPLALAYVLSTHKRENRIIYGFMGVIMAMAVFYSASRGGVACLLLGLSVFTIVMLFKRLRNRGLWIIAAFGLCLLIYLLFFGVIDPILNRVIKTDISAEQRLLVWKGTWNAFMDFWPLGSGLGTFQNIFPLYQPLGITLYYKNAHNDYLELMLEAGMAGVLSILIFFFLLIITYVRGGKNMFYIRLGLAISLFVILVHSLFDFNLHIPSNAMLFSFILGVYIRGNSGLIENHHLADVGRGYSKKDRRN